MKYSEVINKFRLKARKLHGGPDAADKFRATGYNNIAMLLEQNLNVNAEVNEEDLDKLKITKHMKDKILQLNKRARSKSATKKTSRARSRSKSATKKATNAPKTEKNRTRKATNAQLETELMQIMGIGSERARHLISEGLTSVEQLKSKKWLKTLPTETQIFLTIKPMSPIPHDHIAALERIITNITYGDKKTIDAIIVGSYRRQKPMSGDIDVMITDKNKDILDIFYEKLKERVDGMIYPYSRGSDKISLVIDMTNILRPILSRADANQKSHETKNSKNKYVYKLDLFRCEPEYKVPMLLYSTGSKEFNVRMRALAKKKGYLLNQKGLFSKSNNKKVPGLYDERDYFNFLGMEYLQPNERV